VAGFFVSFLMVYRIFVTSCLYDEFIISISIHLAELTIHKLLLVIKILASLVYMLFGPVVLLLELCDTSVVEFPYR
jgi:hypothetical protein